MGKYNRQKLERATKDMFSSRLSRDDALRVVMRTLANNPTSSFARKMIYLYGLTAEELSESGLTYEILRSLDGILT